MRLIDADKLCEEFKRRQNAALNWKEQAILNNNLESEIRADAVLAFLSEVKLTIDNAPTVEDRQSGRWIYHKADDCFLPQMECSVCGATDILAENITPLMNFTDLERKVIADSINYLLGAELLEENGYTEEVVNSLKSVLQKIGSEENHL
jgi:hypothetical protein